MRRKTFLLMFILAAMLVVSACGQGTVNDSRAASTEENGEYPYGHYEDDRMIGKAWAVTGPNKALEVDISEWKKRDRKGPVTTDEGYGYLANFSEETLITYEDGTAASIEDIKNGQKILVNPPATSDDFEGHADEIVLLDMTFEEKYWRMLSHIEGFNIVVMYEYGNPPPPEMDETMYGKVITMLVGQHDVVAAFIEYDPNYVVDFKEELNIEQFPVIFVFDQNELLFQSYNTEEMYAFFEDMKK